MMPYRDHGGHKNEANPADPYMTVLGYFNALRELGGARRILEEEVQNTLKAPLANEILFGKLTNGGTAHVDVKAGEITIECEGPDASN